MKTCSEKALEWNVTPRTVNAMCKNGRIQGAVKEKRTWLIPDDAEKPLDGRISTGKYSRKKTGKEKNTDTGIGTGTFSSYREGSSLSL